MSSFKAKCSSEKDQTRQKFHIPKAVAHNFDAGEEYLIIAIKSVKAKEQNIAKRLKELEIEIPLGIVCSGKAYTIRSPIIARRANGWSTEEIAHPEFRRVDGRVVWMAAVPIPDLKDNDSILAVLYLDCIDQNCDLVSIRSALDDLHAMCQKIATSLHDTM